MSDPDKSSHVMALNMSIFAVGALLLSLMSNEWILSDGWRQGLFFHCIDKDARAPYPFNVQDKPGDCYQSREKGYIQACASLGIVSLVTCIAATLLILLGLRTTDYKTKYSFYRFALYVHTFSFVSLVTALIVYHYSFAAEMHMSNRNKWTIGWAYGLAIGSTVFFVSAIVALILSPGNKELAYNQRKFMST